MKNLDNHSDKITDFRVVETDTSSNHDEKTDSINYYLTKSDKLSKIEKQFKQPI